MSKKKNTKITNITKNEAEGCYMGRIMRCGIKYQKNFTAKKLGGWGEARKQALAWVEKMKTELPSLDESRKGNLSKRNSSGVVGVSLRRIEMNRTEGGVYEYWAWVTKWAVNNKTFTTRFNVSRILSDDDAFVLAVLSRQMESVNKKKIFAQFERIKGTKEHQDILDLKLLSLEWSYEEI
jgi:hypothetical protein